MVDTGKVLKNGLIRRKLNDIAKEYNLENFEISIVEASVKGDNYVSDIYRAQIKETKKIDGRHLDFVVKVPPNCEVMQGNFPVREYFVREVTAYNELFPIFAQIQDKYKVAEKNKFQFVKCYSASCVEDEEYLILEDLKSSGFVMFDRFKEIDYDHAVLVMSLLAKFHSLSIILRRESLDVFNNLALKCTEVVGIDETYSTFLNTAMENAYSVLEVPEHKIKFEKYAVSMVSEFCKAADPVSSEPFNMICHGDCWSNNFLFKYENGKPVDVRLIDFQVMRNTSPMIDLSYFIFTSTEQPFRDDHFDSLLDVYYKNLQRCLRSLQTDPDISFPETIFKDHIAKFLYCGLSIAICCIPTVLADTPINMGLVFEGDNDNENKNVDLTEQCKHRIRGVVKFFADRGII